MFRFSLARWDAILRSAPANRAFNHAVAGEHFNARFGRWPLAPDDPAATINDVIFHRMIDPEWTPLERRLVDKHTAKQEVERLCPELRHPRTLAVIPVETLDSAEALFERLRPFMAMDAVAKPAHASGAIAFLRNIRAPGDVQQLLDLSRVDYATILREMQYAGLPKTILVEEMVPVASPGLPDDYKFHCVRGEPLVCQVDHGRFGAGWSRIYDVPDFTPMDPLDGLVAPAGFRLARDERIRAMIAAARRLSAPFEFVRVDLYDGADGVYFGEVTFSPAAALGIAPSHKGSAQVNATHRIYSARLMAALRGGTGQPLVQSPATCRVD